MARPKKCTVDYFPHFVTGNSRTVFILEQKYGNDGYALWFKLLELLAVTDGHYVDFNDHTDLEFFAAKSKVDANKALEIINQLAVLKAIDRELWKHKVVWCQNFVNNLSDLYARRRISLPQKPSLDEFMYTETSTSEGLCTTETPKVNKSIVEESIEKESKEKKSKGNGVSNDFSFVQTAYEENIGLLSGTVSEIIQYYLDEQVDPNLIIEAIKVACMNNRRSMSYAEGVLKNWLNDGIYTVSQYKSLQVEKTTNTGKNVNMNDFKNMADMLGGEEDDF
ncbi:hypothetical protein CS063_15005 [Sporanaerobium hydrogeniformans]|uniref:Uncharacterized protein n=1 Tax=Sporanaerobium hydrogeniformans TaxID=3072179 RepID=A0AC61D972_9FIRM|nr:DnaD domain protein [Sporanaerobium hydrogeniformans]PHV69552.1 hypothetical protein CS063_15005 [Sporanaerobium hydrogeniformans]